MPTVRVLFVCLGNICRSPTAEGVFTSLLTSRGLTDFISTDSAGTQNWHSGHPPDPRAIVAATKRGIDIGHLRARQFTSQDFTRFDYLMAMDNANVADMSTLGTKEQCNKIHLLLDFAPKQSQREVPDPYYDCAGGFPRVLDLIETACEGLLQYILAQGDHRPSE